MSDSVPTDGPNSRPDTARPIDPRDAGQTAPAADGGPAQVRRIARALAQAPRPLLLESRVQHYGWGDPDFIPNLIGEVNAAREPFAELWIGAHHDLPSLARVDGTRVPLDALIEAAPALLCAQSRASHGDSLPFLFKVLAAAQPLSIQVHPHRAQAQAGFAREEALGVPRGAPQRNYRDANHKPELLVALTDFYALRGFRPLDEVAALLAGTPELAHLADGIDTADDLGRCYRQLMRLPQTQVNRLLDPMIARLDAEDAHHPFAPDDHRHWLLHADRLYSRDGQRDRGLFAMLLLNLVHLHPGQAIYLPSGELHSYLQGVGLELMANSNNVLRGGLTRKHIDVEALLDVVEIDPAEPQVIEPRQLAHKHWRYETTAPEFALEGVQLAGGAAQALETPGIALGLVLDGEIQLCGGALPERAPLRVPRGGTLMIPAGWQGRVSAVRDSRLQLASVPSAPPVWGSWTITDSEQEAASGRA